MNEKTMKKIKITTVILGVLLLIMLAYPFYEHYQDLKNELASYEVNMKEKNKKINEYKVKISNYEQQINFMDSYVAICPLDGSGLYHKYGCKHLDSSSFLIYNTAQAPNEGYSPCYYCSKLDNTSDSKTEIVYVTDTGSKYHRDGCSYLKSKNAITKGKAINQGYTACSKCNP